MVCVIVYRFFGWYLKIQKEQIVYMNMNRRYGYSPYNNNDIGYNTVNMIK